MDIMSIRQDLICISIVRSEYFTPLINENDVWFGIKKIGGKFPFKKKNCKKKKKIGSDFSKTRKKNIGSEKNIFPPQKKFINTPIIHLIFKHKNN